MGNGNNIRYHFRCRKHRLHHGNQNHCQAQTLLSLFKRLYLNNQINLLICTYLHSDGTMQTVTTPGSLNGGDIPSYLFMWAMDAHNTFTDNNLH